MKININKTLIYILIVGFVIRIINFNQSLWLDEAINTLAVKHLNLNDLITNYTINDFHPPLYHLILYFWTKLFGYAEVAVRFPSLISALLSIIVLYFIGRDFFSKKVGLVASMLLSVSPLSVYYSQEARMYSLTMLFALLSVYFFLHLKNGNFSNKNIICFIISTILGLYSDYLFWIFAVVLLFYLALQTKQKGKVILISMILFIAILPWLNILFKQIQQGLKTATAEPIWKSVVGTASIKALLLVPVKFSIGRISFFNKINYLSYLLPILLLETFSLLRSLKKYKKDIFPFIIWLFVPTIIAFVISFFIPVFAYFRLLFTLPALLVILAVGLNKNIILLYVLVIFNITSTFMYILNPNFHRENWKEAVRYIQNNSTSNSVSLLVNTAQGAPYEFYSEEFINGNNLSLTGFQVPLIDKKEINNSYDKIWFIRYAQPIFDKKEEVKMKIDDLGYIKVSEKDFNGVTVWEYKKI